MDSNSSSSTDQSVQDSNNSAISQDCDFSEASGDSSRSLFSNESENQDYKGESGASSSAHSSITDNQSTQSSVSHNSNSDNPNAESSDNSNSNSHSMATNSNCSNHSSDTEEYEVPTEIIQINDTQNMSQEAAGSINISGDDGDDDDVILIPAEIETIDLCTQILPTPRAFLHNEVIEIQDSPSTQQQFRTDEAGPSRNCRQNVRNKTDPYPKKRMPNLNDSEENCSTQSIKMICPICLESIGGRNPVSTSCGHLFCKNCLQMALKLAKKCPMCKKNLPGKTAFHDIFL